MRRPFDTKTSDGHTMTMRTFPIKRAWIAALAVLCSVSPMALAGAEACPMAVLPDATMVSRPMDCCPAGHCDCSVKTQEKTPDMALSASPAHGPGAFATVDKGARPVTEGISAARAKHPRSSEVIPKKKLYDLNSSYRL